MNIKDVTITDLQELQLISRQTFSETFSEMNSAENMSKYLDESFSTKQLSAEINNPESKFYFVINDEKVIGYLKLNFGSSQTELQDHKAIEIERIYVLKEFHGKKIGQFLYDKAIQVAKLHNAEYIWLGVWEENQKALKFYRKNGFIEFDKHKFKLGDDVQTDYLMKLNLKGK